MFRYMFQAAIEGADVLKRDEDLVARWREALKRLPRYPTTGGEQPVVVDVQDAPPITYNIAVPAVPVFPGDVVTWFSPPAEKELFTRTIRGCRWNGNNSAIILSVARARMSTPGTLDWLRTELQSRTRPNGTLTLNRLGHGINNYGHYTEQFAASMAVSELLLQSVGDIVRVFPAWPKEKPARFRDLRAQGGFLVSAVMADGLVKRVAVTSTVGGRLRLLSPWQAITLLRNGKPEALAADEHGVVTLDTRPDDRLVFASAASCNNRHVRRRDTCPPLGELSLRPASADSRSRAVTGVLRPPPPRTDWLSEEANSAPVPSRPPPQPRRRRTGCAAQPGPCRADRREP